MTHFLSKKGIRSWIDHHRLVTVILLLLVLLLAFMVLVRYKKRDFGPVTEPIHRGTIVESVYGIGTITARKIFNLKLGVTSTVQEVFVMEGDVVRRGQRLISLDGTGTPLAPFDGMVTSLLVKSGETVFPQASILSVVDLSDRYVVVSLEQRGAIRVRVGQRARLNFDNLRDLTFDGQVESVYSHLGSFLVRIHVSGLPTQILPGMTADVAIIIGERKNALLIPTAAVDSGRVYLRGSLGNPSAVDIKIGITDGELTEVISGQIEEGDRLLVRKKVAR